MMGGGDDEVLSCDGDGRGGCHVIGGGVAF